MCGQYKHLSFYNFLNEVPDEFVLNQEMLYSVHKHFLESKSDTKFKLKKI